MYELHEQGTNPEFDDLVCPQAICDAHYIKIFYYFTPKQNGQWIALSCSLQLCLTQYSVMMLGSDQGSAQSKSGLGNNPNGSQEIIGNSLEYEDNFVSFYISLIHCSQACTSCSNGCVAYDQCTPCRWARIGQKINPTQHP
jgi:hypothetical protein